jgi:hypothetical protein
MTKQLWIRILNTLNPKIPGACQTVVFALHPGQLTDVISGHGDVITAESFRSQKKNLT